MAPVLPFGPAIFPYSVFLINFYWLFVSMPVQALYFNLLVVPLNIILDLTYGNHSLLVFLMYCVGPTIYIFFRNVKWAPSPNLIRNFIIWSVVIGVVMSPTGILTLRGIQGVYNEPSHFGRFVLGALILGSLLYGWKMTAPGIAILAFNKSGSAFILWVLSYFAKIFSLRRAVLLRFLVIGALLVFAILLLARNEKIGASFRFLAMVNTWISIAESDREFNSVQVLQAVGSRRLPQIAVGFLSVSKYPLGRGAGSYDSTMFETSRMIGIDLTQIKRYDILDQDSIKPTSYYSQIVYDFGIFGIASIMLFVMFTYLKIRKKKNGIAIWLIGHYLLALNTTTTFPLPWVFLGLVENPLWPNIKKMTGKNTPPPATSVAEESTKHSASEA
jgi:hypothetical protein